MVRRMISRISHKKLRDDIKAAKKADKSLKKYRKDKKDKAK